ncbi:MAG: hypothetical protein IANPNBLG_03325 [Bryobacteraceae bacterium]|nr:hypothetical protein [Bryobacteraceae bacterium]
MPEYNPMPTISQAHSDAARINGARSHGPISPEGKARSSQNGRTHGFTASRIVFKSPEEQADYDALVRDYTAHLKPNGPIELDIFHQLIHAAWRLRNLALADAQLYEKASGDPLLSEDPEIEKRAALLHRYRTTAERAYSRALNQLKSLQNNRLYQEQFSHLLPPEAPPLANAERFSSRTQANLRNELTGAIKQAREEAKSFSSTIGDMLSQFRK